MGGATIIEGEELRGTGLTCTDSRLHVVGGVVVEVGGGGGGQAGGGGWGDGGALSWNGMEWYENEKGETKKQKVHTG